MMPTVEIYYDARLPDPPEILKWLQDCGIPSIVRSPTEAPAEWQRRYGCCLPWVAVDGRIHLKGGFQKNHFDRLVRRWKGRALVGIGVASESLADQKPVVRAASEEGGSSFHTEHWDLGPTRTGMGLQPMRWGRWADADNCEFKLASYFSAAFRRGYQPVIVCFQAEGNPSADPVAIQEVLDSLRNYDVMYGCDGEGAWKYLALRAWLGALFSEETHGWRLDLKSLSDPIPSNQLKVKRLDRELLVASAES